MELIGKQIAIETILGQPPELHYPSWYAAQIEKLPPAPPEYLAEQAGILVADTDTISRQAVIDLLKQMRKDGDMIPWEGKDVFARIRKLPSAQPEIVRCKDCKHHWTHRCMDSMPIERCDLGQTFYDAEVDYCSLAERREVTA